MNENCKYCKTSKTCLENADYGSIYCQLHKKIPKVIGKTYDELQLENEQLKLRLEQRDNIINKAREYIKIHKRNLIHEITHEEYEILDDENIINLLEILDNKGE